MPKLQSDRTAPAPYGVGPTRQSGRGRNRPQPAPYSVGPQFAGEGRQGGQTRETPGLSASLGAAYGTDNPFLAAERGPTDPEAVQGGYNQYLKQFNESLAADRARIDAQLADAIQGLTQRRDAAANVVAAMPTAIDEAYNAATGGMQDIQQHAAAGLSPDVQLDPNVAAQIQAQTAQNKGASAQTVPLLEAGVTQRYSAGKAALDQAAMQARAATDAEFRDLLLRQMDRESSRDDAAEQRAFEREMADRQFRREQFAAEQDRQAQQEAEARQWAREQQLASQEPDPYEQARGMGIVERTGLTPDEYAKAETLADAYIGQAGTPKRSPTPWEKSSPFFSVEKRGLPSEWNEEQIRTVARMHPDVLDVLIDRGYLTSEKVEAALGITSPQATQ